MLPFEDLPGTPIVDATNLVNRVRLIKSPKEIDYMAWPRGLWSGSCRPRSTASPRGCAKATPPLQVR